MMRSPLRQGVTFPELLVAMLCATLVAWMVFDLVGDENRNYTRTRAKVRTQNDAREAMRIIEEDLKNSGFHRLVLPLSSKGFTPISPVDSICPLAKENRIRVIDGVSGPDELWISSYLPRNNFCDQLVLIHYFIDGTGNLVRELTRGTTVIRSVVLPNVQTLQFQIGVDTTSDDTTRRSGDTVAAQTNVGLQPTPVTGMTASTFTSNDTIVLTGFTPGTAGSILSASQMTLAPNSTYRVSLDMRPNQNLISWHDTLPNAGESIQLGLSNASVWVPGAVTRVAFPPDFRGPNRVLWQFSTDNSGLTASLRLDLLFPIRATPGTQPESLYISRLRVVRVRDAGQILNNPNWTWYDGDNGTPALRRQTLAVRAWILSKSTKKNIEGEATSFGPIANWNGTGSTAADKNAYVLHERVIPVVNP